MQFLKKCFKITGFLLSLPAPAFALNDTYVIHFVLDGAQKKFVHEQIEKGELPHLKKYFFENGVVFDKAITTFPTVSSPGYISFITGLSAGNSGVFFLEWFDRTNQKVIGYLTTNGRERANADLINRLELKDTDVSELYPPLTIFEKLAPEPTAAVYTPFNRGAAYKEPRKYPVQGLWNALITRDGLALNKLAMREVEKLFSKSPDKLPRYTLAGLYGTDFYGHHSGPKSEEVAAVLKQFDLAFHRFTENLKTRGLSDKTYIIVSSDHGMHATGKLSKLRDVFWKKGVRKSDPIYISNRGVSSTFIYAGGSQGWEELPTLFDLRNFQAKKGTVDLIQSALDNESVDWLAAREDLDRVHVFDREGEGLIVGLMIGNRKYYSYSFKGRDPLGFAGTPGLEDLLKGEPHPQEVWFQKTLETKRPNAVVDLSGIFQDPRAGDILVVAKDSYGFRSAKAGTHGSLNPEDMHIPLWIAGPGLKPQRLEAAKSSDLYPTVLNWLGSLAPEDLKNQEGKILFTGGSTSPEEADLWLAKLEKELATRPPLSRLPNRHQLAEDLNNQIPPETKAEILQKCEKEIALRYQRWKKLDRLQGDLKEANNPLKIPGHLKKNMDWLFANEKNIEFMRLRRMEDIQSILKNP